MQNRVGKHYRSINQPIFFVAKMRKKTKRKAKGKKGIETLMVTGTG